MHNYPSAFIRSTCCNSNRHLKREGPHWALSKQFCNARKQLNSPSFIYYRFSIYIYSCSKVCVCMCVFQCIYLCMLCIMYVCMYVYVCVSVIVCVCVCVLFHRHNGRVQASSLLQCLYFQYFIRTSSSGAKAESS